MRIFIILLSILTLSQNGLALHKPLPFAQYILALDLYSQGDYYSSLKEFNNLKDEHPEQTRYVGNSYYWKGLCYYALKKYSQAEKQFNKVINYYPKSDYYVQSVYQLGKTKYSMKQYGPAIRIFSDFYRKYRRSDLRDNSLFWKGVCYYRMKDNKKALNDFYEVLKKFPLGNKDDAARYMILLIKGGSGQPEIIYQKVEVPADNKLGDLAELLRTKEAALKEKEAAVAAKEDTLKAKEDIINQAQEKLNVK
ncbi:MAG: tetratricopeptide repeat protein [bacterium]|nr:tetratricopeptide repeat protein [bacterium]